MNPENIGIEYPILEEEERKRKLLRMMIWWMKDGFNWMEKERAWERKRKKGKKEDGKRENGKKEVVPHFLPDLPSLVLITSSLSSLIMFTG